MKLPLLAAVGVLLLTRASPAAPAPLPETQAAAAQANDNRSAAGELAHGVLTLRLELVTATWYPEKDGGPSLQVYAFAETGHAPQIPGPLLRIPQGTEVRVSVHNTLPLVMFVRGLNSHDAADAQPWRIGPGETASTHFIASAAGTYYYAARSTNETIRDVALLPVTADLPMGEGPFEIESPLSGAFVVDLPGRTLDDRIFVITLWMKGVINPPFGEVATINGKAWPYTERLSYRIGDTVRWRVLNPSMSDHAMHLHGFYYQVNSHGDGQVDHSFTESEAMHVVTQYVLPGDTMSLQWTPERAGRWLFHCHMAAHMSDELALAPHDDSPGHLAAHDPERAGMGGLILGVTVSPGATSAPAESGARPRQLHLYVREKPATQFSTAGMGYLIQEAGEKENSDPPPTPGKPLVLTRGEPVEIEIHNQLKQQTSVHWHGIELQSYFDGVPGWSGQSEQTTPAISPGQSFLARFTPPRAGTFIYHTHWHDIAQLAAGLVGPLLVLEPGVKYDPAVDHVFLISSSGPDDVDNPRLLNGSAQPPPLVLKRGTKHRFRFINIGANNSDTDISLRDGGGKPAEWRALAKDGWSLSPALATPRPAVQRITVGETYDFEFTPDSAGNLTLDVAADFLQMKLSQLIVVK